MEIGRLAEFIAIVEHGSFAKAAKSLYTSQSVLSKHVLSMEKELGTPLLSRTGSGLRVTAAGQELLLRAVQITATYDEALKVIDTIKRSRHARLSVNVFKGYKPIDDLVKALVLELRKDFPNIELDLHDITTNDPLEDVLTGSVDLAFVTLPRSLKLSDDLVTMPVISEPICCVVNEKHALASSGSAPISQLEGEVVWQATGGARYMSECVREVFSHNGVNPRYLPFSWICAADYYDRMAFIEGGVHIEFESAVHYSLPRSTGTCVAVKLEGDANITTSAVWLAKSENPVIPMLPELLDAIVKRPNFTSLLSGSYR